MGTSLLKKLCLYRSGDQYCELDNFGCADTELSKACLVHVCSDL